MKQNKEKLFKKLVSDYLFLLKELEETLPPKLLLWLNKYRAIIRNVKQEDKIFAY